MNPTTTKLPAGQLDNGFVLNNANKGLTEAELLVRYEKSLTKYKETQTAYMNPVKGFPNIQDSFVELHGHNKLLKKHGLTRRTQPTLHLKVGHNKHLNKYLDYVIYKLNRFVDDNDPQGFWNFAMKIGERSAVFKAMMLHEVDPHWHREWTYKQLYLTIESYINYFESKPVDLKYRRVYIPKKTDPETGEVLSYRPLGVPTLVWRIYLHSLQVFLMIFLKDRISIHQHGFYKGRGTKTAWEEVISFARDFDNI